MEQKFMLFLYIKISAFILLTWICHFYNKENISKNNLNEKCKLNRKLNIINYRLLAKYKPSKDSYSVKFEDELPHNRVKQNKCVTTNKKGANVKHKISRLSSLYTEEYCKNNKKNKPDISKTKKYSNFEKQIFKELDSKDYLKNIKEIEDKEYKKLSRKKRRIRIVFVVLFFFVLIVPILDLLLENFVTGGLLGSLNLIYLSKIDGSESVKGLFSTLFDIDKWGNSDKIRASTVFIYCLPFLIFVVIFILGMIYYYKKVIKYENIKFKKKINKK
ncbi:Plasmodium exported protein (Pm-fam-a like), unknown function [Plasmodium malariae]|uniref:Fam-l protein n=1 Tax=Plasmodium malariae TaxID=5858 RepID=A0A1A8WZT9_PLAMA|nr:Plasmodium exported protein (Pm-fam-a like), unknown function [Plasmodium malariae]